MVKFVRMRNLASSAHLYQTEQYVLKLTDSSIRTWFKISNIFIVINLGSYCYLWRCFIPFHSVFSVISVYLPAAAVSRRATSISMNMRLSYLKNVCGSLKLQIKFEAIIACNIYGICWWIISSLKCSARDIADISEVLALVITML